jgi:ATP-dependent Clp protease protease subunit
MKKKDKKIYVYDSIGGEGIMALDIIKELSDAEGDIQVHINSGGGSVSQGIAIYNALKEYEGKVHVKIDGLAASIASVIAMSGTTVTMAEGSLLMVHMPWTTIAGNAEDLRKEAEVLDQHMETLVDIYASNSPLSRDEIKSMLAEETWLTAEEAYELGMITDIAGELKQAASVDIDRFNNAPNQLLKILDYGEEEEEEDAQAKSMTPNDAMVRNATRALEWREEFGRGGTEVGVARARDIKNRKELSQDTVNRMISYFARHEVDKKAEGFSQGEEGFPSAGRIAWDLWGGDAGKSWANARKDTESDSVEEKSDSGPQDKVDENADHLQENLEKDSFIDNIGDQQKDNFARLEAARQRLATIEKLAAL